MFEFILFLVLYVLFLFDMGLAAVVKGQLYGTIITISRKIIEVYDEETGHLRDQLLQKDAHRWSGVRARH